MKKAKAKSKAKTRPAPKKVKKVAPIPAGSHAVTPYLSIRGAAQALEFYSMAFGAKEMLRFPGPDGKLGHAEIKIGDSRIMLADEYPEMNILSPQSRGGTTVSLYIYVSNADATVERAVAAGAKILRPVADQFYGDRTGTIEDPFGHMWHVGTHKEDLSKAELRKRGEQAMAKAGGG
jgi:PhnB protein